jgi:hypothetical protein
VPAAAAASQAARSGCRRGGHHVAQGEHELRAIEVDEQQQAGAHEFLSAGADARRRQLLPELPQLPVLLLRQPQFAVAGRLLDFPGLARLVALARGRRWRGRRSCGQPPALEFFGGCGDEVGVDRLAG